MRRKGTLTSAFPLLLSLGVVASAADQLPLKTHEEVIRSDRQTFTIDVAGNNAPENVEITIENTGDSPVVNPRIVANDLYNWYTLADMVREVTRKANSDEEKVMAIFDFVKTQSYWWPPPPMDFTGRNPVRHFNIYGYHICSDAAGVFVGLCRAAGIDARIWEIWHHTVAEAKWDGAWHHMDPDYGLWYLKDDNRTIASMADLEAHPEWVARSYRPYRWYLAPGDDHKVIYMLDAERAEDLSILYGNKDYHYVTTDYDRWIYKEQTMNFTLRPRESLTRWWRPVLGKYFDQARNMEPPRYANGRLVFEPDFSRYTYQGLVHRDNIKFQAEDHQGPAVHVGKAQDRIHDQPSSLTIPMASPYVMVGGYIDTEFEKSGTREFDQISLSANLNPANENPILMWNFDSGPIFQFYGSGHPRAVLDDHMPRAGRSGTYSFDARYSISLDSRNHGQRTSLPLKYGQSGLISIKIVADLQVNPGSLPALRLGRNVIRYSDETPGAHEVKVIYKWRERWDPVPDAPASAVAPKDGGTSSTLAPGLEWTPAGDHDSDSIVNYQVRVSLRPDCAWPVASTLERDVRAGTAFQVPGGWLTPETVYYWQVRAEDSRGNHGRWSKAFSFRTPRV